MTTPSVGTLNPDAVQIGTSNGPGIYLAPPGTDLPASVSDDFADPWHVLGYLSDDGPTVGQTTDSEDITPWQSKVPIRTVITSRGVTLQFVLWEIRRETLALYFDTDVPEGTGDDVDLVVRTDMPQHLYAVAIDSRDADRVLRIGFYRASLSEAGDMDINSGSAVPLDCTLSALDDGGQMCHIMAGAAATVTPAAAQARAASARSSSSSSGGGGAAAAA